VAVVVVVTAAAAKRSVNRKFCLLLNYAVSICKVTNPLEELSTSIFMVYAVTEEYPHQKICYSGNGNWNSGLWEWCGNVRASGDWYRQGQ
jgi:hypothetical protein